jgi:hypothetical protein
MKRVVVFAVALSSIAGLLALPLGGRFGTAHAQARPQMHCVVKIEPINLSDFKAGKSSKIDRTTCTMLKPGEVPLVGQYAVVVFCLDATFGNCNLEYDGPAGSGGNCSGTSVYYQEPSMPSGWNDDISSYETFRNCYAAALFEDGNYAINNPDGNGTEFTSYPGSAHSPSYVGAAMNDRTSSWRLMDTCHDLSSCIYPGA